MQVSEGALMLPFFGGSLCSLSAVLSCQDVPDEEEAGGGVKLCLPGCWGGKSSSALVLGLRLCGFGAPEPVCSPGPAPRSRTLTSGNTGSRAALGHVSLASNQQTVPQHQPCLSLDRRRPPHPQLQPLNPGPKTPLPRGPHLPRPLVLQILDNFSNPLCLLGSTSSALFRPPSSPPGCLSHMICQP